LGAKRYPILKFIGRYAFTPDQYILLHGKEFLLFVQH
jgi:hypothetical protein